MIIEMFNLRVQAKYHLLCVHLNASKPEMEFHMIDITYAAMHMRAQTKKTTFSCKDDCGCILEWGKGLVQNSDCTRPELTQACYDEIYETNCLNFFCFVFNTSKMVQNNI